MPAPLADASPGAFDLAGWRVEPDSRRLIGAGGETRLETKTMQVLVYLAHNPGRVVSRAELEARVWPGRVVTEDAVTNSIRKLRRAFNDSAREPRVIETIPKSGYRLIAEVTPAPAGAVRPRTPAPPRRTPRRQRLALIASAVVLSLMTILLLLLGMPDPERGPVTTAAVPVSGKPRVVVLGLRNVGGDRDQDYFANGITADLVTDLSRLSGLGTLAAGTAALDVQGDAEARELATRLGGDYLLSGDVQRAGERLRVNMRLMRVDDGRTLWAERFEGAMREVFDLQDALVDAVIGALQVQLVPAERTSLDRRPSASVAAYDLYLRGIEEHGHRTAAENRSARARFERAIELDPAFARAYAGLAMTHARDAMDGWTATPRSSLERAARLAERAVLLEPSLPQAHFAAAQVDLFLGLHDQALHAIERALQIDPNYADGHALRAWIHHYAGRPTQAMASMRTAMRLNPRPPASYLEVLGEVQFAQGSLADAAASFRRVLEINPDYMRARMWLAATLARSGADGPAEWETLELAVQNPTLSIDRIRHGLPFRDPRQLDQVLAALRHAGMRD